MNFADSKHKDFSGHEKNCKSTLKTFILNEKNVGLLRADKRLET